MLVAMLTTFDDPDPAHLRYRRLSQNGVDIRIEEDQDGDWERQHSAEKISYLAVEDGNTPFQGIPSECYFLPTAFDQSVIIELGKVTVIPLKDPSLKPSIYPVLLTLPTKGTLFHYQPETLNLNQSISDIATKVEDVYGRVLYQAYDMVDAVESEDWFTYRLQDDQGHMSNVGTVLLKMTPDSITTVKTDTQTKMVSQPVVIYLVFIFTTLSVLLIAFFGIFLYKRKKAREELAGFLSLSGVVTDEEGGTTYFSKPADADDSSVEFSGDNSDK